MTYVYIYLISFNSAAFAGTTPKVRWRSESHLFRERLGMQTALMGTCSRGLSDSVRVQTSTPNRVLQNQRVLQDKALGMAKPAPTACPCVCGMNHISSWISDKPCGTGVMTTLRGQDNKCVDKHSCVPPGTVTHCNQMLLLKTIQDYWLFEPTEFYCRHKSRRTF